MRPKDPVVDAQRVAAPVAHAAERTAARGRLERRSEPADADADALHAAGLRPRARELQRAHAAGRVGRRAESLCRDGGGRERARQAPDPRQRAHRQGARFAPLRHRPARRAQKQPGAGGRARWPT
ncbi:MAG: hypothetical protein MZW92_07050 [Comamonadaceae bacterium]|nr:hypothetical protein [Comamonadaceae bacterium]